MHSSNKSQLCLRKDEPGIVSQGLRSTLQDPDHTSLSWTHASFALHGLSQAQSSPDNLAPLKSEEDFLEAGLPLKSHSQIIKGCVHYRTSQSLAENE